MSADNGDLRLLVNHLRILRNQWREVDFWGRNKSAGLSLAELDKEVGYETNPDIGFYADLYARGGVAARVVNIWPDECWAAYPELYETEEPRRTKLERAWERVSRKVLPWHYLHRADRLSGIGHYGVLLLGLGDQRPLSEPAPNVDPDTGEPISGEPSEVEMLYLRSFDQSLVTVNQVEDDKSNPRYNHPKLYTIDFSSPSAGTQTTGLIAPAAPVSADVTGGLTRYEAMVHWTRIIHLADNRHSSEVYGIPRMAPVLNYLHDIRKVCAGSGEMFWKGGFPGYSFEVDPAVAGEAEVDLTAIREEVLKYTKGLQRYLTAQGGSWKALTPQVADPRPHLEQYVQLLCATLGVPTRIFLGSESGHLASTQDAGAWKERLRGRQLNYLEPMVVRPFVNRLMDIGVLPRTEDYIISWRDLQTLSDQARADVALKQVQTLFQYVSGNVNQVLPLHLLLTLFMGLSESQATAIESELKKNPPELLIPANGQVQSGVRKGKASTKKKGRPANTPPEGEPRPVVMG